MIYLGFLDDFRSGIKRPTPTQFDQSLDSLIERWNPIRQNKNFSATTPIPSQFSFFKDGYDIELEPAEDQLLFRSAKSNEEFRYIDYGFESDDYYLNEEIRDFDNHLETMIQQINGALNDTREQYKSYSKTLGVPLLKYTNRGTSPLVINFLSTNKVILYVRVTCFYQTDRYDTDGDKLPRNDDIIICLEVPLDDLFNKEKMYKHIDDYFEPEEGEVRKYLAQDDINFQVAAITIDMSNINRNKWNLSSQHLIELAPHKKHLIKKIKSSASFKTDKEVLTTSSHLSDKGFYIKDPNFLFLLRVYYVAFISTFQETVDLNLIEDVFYNKHLHILEVDQKHQNAFILIKDYLNDPTTRLVGDPKKGYYRRKNREVEYDTYYDITEKFRVDYDYFMTHFSGVDPNFKNRLFELITIPSSK